MSIFTKPLSQVDAADLQELVQEQAAENLRLEFKLEVPDKDEMLKKLSAFANTFGGLMVIGARASSKDGRITELSGVDKMSGFKQKVVDWCFKGVSPPLEVDASDPIPTPSGNGKFIYVVKLAESDVAPHFLNGRNGVWVRTNEFSGRFEQKLADEIELRHLFDRRKLVLERREALLQRARERYEALADKTNMDLAGHRTKLGARLELAIVPRFPAHPLCKQEDLKSLVPKSTLTWRLERFPKVENGIISQHESALVLHTTLEDYSIFEANIWGLIFHGTRIDENREYLITGTPDATSTTAIHLHQFVGYVLVFVANAAKMLHALDYSGPIHIEVRLKSIRGVGWLRFVNYEESERPGSELDDEVAFTIPITSSELNSRPDGIAMDVLRYALFSVNSSDLVDTPETLEQVIRRGYTFNAWSTPAVLRT
jgi:Putative DNA-binding domain